MKGTLLALTAIIMLWLGGGFYFWTHDDELGGFLMFFSLFGLVVFGLYLASQIPPTTQSH